MLNNIMDTPLWQYACTVYEQPGIAPLLLTLQDDEGLHINTLLFACWLGKQGYQLTVEDMEKLQRHIFASQAEIVPLRSARKACKTQDPQQYAHLKQLELAMEQAQLYEMFNYFKHLQTHWTRNGNIANNMRHCLDFYGCTGNDASQQLIHCIREISDNG